MTPGRRRDRCPVSTGAQFGAVKEAKDFLVEKIAAEASRDHMPLSEVERQMLYFTEEDGLSEQMRQVCEAFDRDHDVDEYEAKFEKLTALCQSMEHRLNNSESCSSSKFVDTPDHATHHSVDSLQVTSSTCSTYDLSDNKINVPLIFCIFP